MKNFILFLIGAMLISLSSYAQTNLSSHFTANTTLTVANSPYVVTTNLNVNTGVTLTIESGVVIKFNAGRYLQVIGTLNATGATFTANESTAKGFWDGIYVSHSSYDPGSVTLENCTVEYASNLYDRNGALNLKNTTLNNFSGYGVQVETKGNLTIEGTTIKNTNHPIYFSGPGMLKSAGVNVLTGNTEDYIYLNFNDVSGTFNMPDMGIPYRLTTFRVGTSGIVNIAAGAKLYSYNSEITINGKIKANGTPEKPVIFSKHPNASYFYGINITDNSVDSAVIFKYTNFKTANYNNDAYVAVDINNASPTFENCKFMENTRNLFVSGISQPVFTNCNFEASTIVGGEAYNVAMDMNATLDLSTDSIKFNSSELRAIRILPSTVIDDAHLKKISFKNIENITFCLYETTTVHDTASLVIDPGVVIKSRQYNAMITANGTLNGLGTESEPIVFTHLADDNFGNPKDTENNGAATPGNSNSGRIALYSTATSKIKNWKIYYGGYNSSNWAVYVSKGNIVENCEIKNSHRGIYFYDNAQILNNSFSNINSYPIGRKVNQGTPVLIGNTVSNVGTLGILIGEFANDSPTLKSMDFAGLTNVAYVVESNLAIAEGNIVTVDPGVVIKFQNSTSGYLTVNGALKAIGKENNKIIFTSINDDSAGGDTNNNGTTSTPSTSDWQGLDFTGTASDTENILKNCEVRYSGYYYYYGSIRMTDCRVVMDSTKVNFSYWGSLSIFGNANPEIKNCQFYNMNNAPIYMDMFANPTFSNNKVANLPRIGLRIRGGSISGTIPVRSFAGYDNISYIIEEDMTVANANELIIPAGTSFKGDGRWLIHGKVDVQGTSENPVVFSAQEDDMYGMPKDMQQNGNTNPGNGGNYFIFYDDANDLSKINYALFRYSKAIPIQTNNASPIIQNSTFENMNYDGISLSGSSAPTITDCTFNNIPFPFRTSLVTYPASTSGNTISGTTGRAIRVTDETLTQNSTLLKRSFAGITNIPYVFQNYTVGTGAILTINPGVVCKFGQNGYMNVYNGIKAIGGNTPETTVVFTADRDDFYGGDTYGDGDTNLPNSYYWRGIKFFNESIDENCILENCIFKNASDYYYSPDYAPYDPNRYAAITLDNSSPTITSCLFESNYYGIISRNTSLPTITNCDFVGTNPTYGYAIQNQTSTNTVTAENCWWNHNTGPYNATSNPGGQGERVSNYVDFTPWATQLAKPVVGDVSMNGEVKPFDASLVLQHAATLITLDAKQQSVADVSGNGLITAYDASLILQYSVGIISRFDPEPLGTKAASINDYASISFPGAITETAKKSFEIPLTVSTADGIKALDMKYSFNPAHVKFLGLNKANLPSGLSIEAGFNSQKGEITISMASAYDLKLISQQLVLEFEFVESVITESQFGLTMAMANDYTISDTPIDATISSKTIATGLDNLSQLKEPIIFTDQYGIHTKFELSKANQNLFIQVFDLTGRTVYNRTVRNLNSGIQNIDLLYADFTNQTKGIYILNLKAEEFSYSKKLLIK